MKNFKFIASVILSIGIFGLASCSKNDATYNPNYEKEVVASQYMKNFEAKYGKISADATWDFSNVPTINGEIDVKLLFHLFQLMGKQCENDVKKCSF